jgi:hypothetical protein
MNVPSMNLSSTKSDRADHAASAGERRDLAAVAEHLVNATVVPGPRDLRPAAAPAQPAGAVSAAFAAIEPPAARPILSFTDEDLLAIGPVVSTPDLMLIQVDEPVARPNAPTPPLSKAPTPSLSPTPVPPLSEPPLDEDVDVIGQAAECLLERTGLSRSEAMRLMEHEAADTGQRLVDVARAVLGQDGSATVSGEVALVA